MVTSNDIPNPVNKEMGEGQWGGQGGEMRKNGDLAPNPSIGCLYGAVIHTDVCHFSVIVIFCRFSVI